MANVYIYKDIMNALCKDMGALIMAFNVFRQIAFTFFLLIYYLFIAGIWWHSYAGVPPFRFLSHCQ